MLALILIVTTIAVANLAAGYFAAQRLEGVLPTPAWLRPATPLHGDPAGEAPPAAPATSLDELNRLLQAAIDPYVGR